ncbi:MAG: WxcM-like domain-containing protein [Leadbetterella sp.]|nr:WxcM-like domain-containing protein [Leadbetterella sp.]
MIYTFSGGSAKDHRGEIRFVNDFDMTQVKRFYIIKNTNNEMVRGWRAHKIEQRWFYVLFGAFELDLVKIDNWECPSPNLPVERKILKVENYQVIHVPVGYGTAFRAIEEGSELLVFADRGIEHAPEDDHTWPSDYFTQPQ